MSITISKTQRDISFFLLLLLLIGLGNKREQKQTLTLISTKNIKYLGIEVGVNLCNRQREERKKKNKKQIKLIR